MPAVMIGAMVVSAAATTYSAIEQNKAARNAGQVVEAVANYNAASDRARAGQIDLDTQQNIRTDRQEAGVYLSRQAASYASAGVLATTGSPLHAQIATAGRLEQRIQQEWVDSQAKEQQLYAAADVGVAEGEAQASADRSRGTIALIDGGAKLASTAFSAYEGGMFSGGGGGGSMPAGSFDPG